MCILNAHYHQQFFFVILWIWFVSALNCVFHYSNNSETIAGSFMCPYTSVYKKRCSVISCYIFLKISLFPHQHFTYEIWALSPEHIPYKTIPALAICLWACRCQLRKRWSHCFVSSHIVIVSCPTSARGVQRMMYCFKPMFSPTLLFKCKVNNSEARGRNARCTVP